MMTADFTGSGVIPVAAQFNAKATDLDDEFGGLSARDLAATAPVRVAGQQAEKRLQSSDDRTRRQLTRQVEAGLP